jgi:hypothetical protein
MAHPTLKMLREHPMLQDHIRQHGPGVVGKYKKGCDSFIRASQLKKGERMLIIADHEREPMALGIANAAKEKGIKSFTLIAGYPDSPVKEGSEELKYALAAIGEHKPHATVLLVDKSAWPVRRPIYEATTKSKTNGFTITCPDIRHVDVSHILSGDPLPVQRRTRRVVSLLKLAAKSGHELVLETGKSVFRARLTNKSEVLADDMAPPEGEFDAGMRIANMPGGEAELKCLDEIDGDVFFGPGSLFSDFGHLKKGVVIRFKDGKLHSIGKTKSKHDAGIVAKLNEFMKKHGKGMFEPFSIGTNEHVPIELATTNLTQEKILGTIHIGVGDKDQHADLIAEVTNLHVGGKHLIKDGKWVLK